MQLRDHNEGPAVATLRRKEKERAHLPMKIWERETLHLCLSIKYVLRWSVDSTPVCLFVSFLSLNMLFINDRLDRNFELLKRDH